MAWLKAVARNDFSVGGARPLPPHDGGDHGARLVGALEVPGGLLGPPLGRIGEAAEQEEVVGRPEFLASMGVPGVALGAVADEERGSEKGVKLLLERKALDCDFCFIPDGGKMNEAVIGEKGILWLKIQSVGKQAHGSNPEKGINAIENTCPKGRRNVANKASKNPTNWLVIRTNVEPIPKTLMNLYAHSFNARNRKASPKPVRKKPSVNSTLQSEMTVAMGELP